MKCPKCGSSNTYLTSNPKAAHALASLRRLFSSVTPPGGRQFIVCRDCGQVSGPIMVR